LQKTRVQPDSTPFIRNVQLPGITFISSVQDAVKRRVRTGNTPEREKKIVYNTDDESSDDDDFTNVQNLRKDMNEKNEKVFFNPRANDPDETIEDEELSSEGSIAPSEVSSLDEETDEEIVESEPWDPMENWRNNSDNNQALDLVLPESSEDLKISRQLLVELVTAYNFIQSFHFM
jgi:hypothetical protein